MKRLISCFILICFWLSSSASTSITTPTVSGHWTLAGSPYLVYNNIQIDATQSLTIDPGVNVIFQGPYRLIVSGVLHAVGSDSSRVNFTVNDTTGWATDNLTNLGGWHGILFLTYGGTGFDSSAFQYCDISYTKFDSADNFVSPTLSTLIVGRYLTIRNCNFYQNKVDSNSLTTLFIFYAGFCDVVGCRFFNNTGLTSGMINSSVRSNFVDNIIYDNFVNGGILLTSDSSFFSDNKFYRNYSYSPTVSSNAPAYFHGNQFYNNHPELAIVYQSDADIIFENNTIDSNTVSDASLSLYHCPHALIRKNIISRNISWINAGINCNGGFVDIVGNLICNNQHLTGTCGYTDGGGGLNLGCNPCVTDSCTFTVRNNVIANNYSPFRGGAIYATNAKLIVTNNQIIHNKSLDGGGIYIWTYGYPLSVKNNVFYDNVSTSNSTTAAIEGESFGTIEYDHNWTQHAGTYDLFIISGAYTLAPGILANVVGTNPGLIAPTLTANVTEDALSANFGLLPSSLCVNKGDSTVFIDSVDFAGNPRIIGSNIDIGAYEFNHFCPGAIVCPGHICEGVPIVLSDTTSGGVWSSPQSTAIVTVDTVAGTITGIAPGTATINYVVGACLATSVVTIDSFPIAGIITGADSLCVGTYITLIESALGGLWYASNSRAIVSGGVVTGMATGTDSIIYSVSNACGTITTSKIVTIDSLSNSGIITGRLKVCQDSMVVLLNSITGGVWSVSNSSASISGGVVTGLSPGMDTVIYTLTNHCGISHSIFPVKVLTSSQCDSLTEVNEISFNQRDLINIFPNPAINEITIASTNKITMVSINNLIGQTVLHQICNSEKLKVNVANLPPGVYFIKINGIEDRKFVKQ